MHALLRASSLSRTLKNSLIRLYKSSCPDFLLASLRTALALLYLIRALTPSDIFTIAKISISESTIAFLLLPILML
jgi:hypothetical protein